MVNRHVSPPKGRRNIVIADLQNWVDEFEQQLNVLAIGNFDLRVQNDALVDDLYQYESVLVGWGLKLDDGDLVMVDRDLAVAAIAFFTQALGSSNNDTNAAVAAPIVAQPVATIDNLVAQADQLLDKALSLRAEIDNTALNLHDEINDLASAFEAKYSPSNVTSIADIAAA